MKYRSSKKNCLEITQTFYCTAPLNVTDRNKFILLMIIRANQVPNVKMSMAYNNNILYKILQTLIALENV